MNEAPPHTSVIQRPGEETYARAVALLKQGKPIGFPTETVYGLAGDASSESAVARIFEMKGRPAFNPLIVHVDSIEMAEQLVVMNPPARRIAYAFWPGPLTLVLKRRPDCPVSLLASAGLETLAIRIPAHPVAREIIRRFGGPLAAPSANRSGSISPTLARHVAEDLPVELVVDGGRCDVGLESTVLAVDDEEIRLLRPGGIPAEDIEEASHMPARPVTSPDKITAPGQLSSHYAPSTPLRLEASYVGADEGLLAFGDPLSGAGATLNLSPSGNLVEAAANLFGMLRALDRQGLTSIAAMPVPEEGLGRAINDRLRRAAAPRNNR